MKLRRALLIILVSVLILTLSGCMQMTSNYRVFSDGTYQSDLEILIPLETYEDPDANAATYLAMLLQQLDLEDTEMIEEIIEIDGVEYYALTLNRDRSTFEDAITVTIEDGEALFVHDLSVSDEFMLDLDAFGLGDDYKEVLALQGFQILERIQMPGKIISASCGTVEDDIVTIDIIEEDMSLIIIRSTIDNNVSILVVLFIIVLALLVCLICIYISRNRRKKHRRIAVVDKGPVMIEEENLPVKEANDILDTLALEEKEDQRDLPY